VVETPTSEEGVEFENVSRSSYDKLKQRTQAQRQGADPAAADAAFMALLNLLLQKVRVCTTPVEDNLIDGKPGIVGLCHLFPHLVAGLKTGVCYYHHYL
jgi:hypothetical protein